MGSSALAQSPNRRFQLRQNSKGSSALQQHPGQCAQQDDTDDDHEGQEDFIAAVAFGLEPGGAAKLRRAAGALQIIELHPLRDNPGLIEHLLGSGGTCRERWPPWRSEEARRPVPTRTPPSQNADLPGFKPVQRFFSVDEGTVVPRVALRLLPGGDSGVVTRASI